MNKERELLALILSYAGNKYLTVDEFEMMAQIEETFKEISELLAQPEQNNTQYLLDQVSRLTAENAMLKEKWLAQPEQSSTTRHALDSYWNQEAYQRGYAQAELDLKREPLSEDKLDVLAEANITDEGIAGYYLGFRDAEKAHGIGGGE